MRPTCHRSENTGDDQGSSDGQRADGRANPPSLLLDWSHATTAQARSSTTEGEEAGRTVRLDHAGAIDPVVRALGFAAQHDGR
jgi:hypothetical protein